MSARERRIVLAGTIVVAVGLTATRLIPTWLGWIGAERARAEESARALARARSTIAAVGSTRDQLLVHNERYLALAPRLLGGETPVAASASLASLVSGAAAIAGVQVGALQLRVDSARARDSEGPFIRVSVRGDARGDIRGVTQFLEMIERGPVLLAVRQLAISQPEPAAPPDRPEALRIEFVVEGLAIDRQRVQNLAPSKGK